MLETRHQFSDREKSLGVACNKSKFI